MEKNEIYVDGNHFCEVVAELVTVFLNNMDEYPSDTVVAVQRETKDLQLTSQDRVEKEWEKFPVFSFTRKNKEHYGIEVDMDATHALASNYYAL